MTWNDKRNLQQHADPTIPDEFFCPLTLQVMKNPVMTRAGLTFERSAILQWLSGSFSQGAGQSQRQTCPLTRQPLKAGDLVTNGRLAERIRLWRLRRRTNPDEEDLSQDDDEEESVVLPTYITMPTSEDNELISIASSKSEESSNKWMVRIIKTATGKHWILC